MLLHNVLSKIKKNYNIVGPKCAFVNYEFTFPKSDIYNFHRLTKRRQYQVLLLIKKFTFSYH